MKSLPGETESRFIFALFFIENRIMKISANAKIYLTPRGNIYGE